MEQDDERTRVAETKRAAHDARVAEQMRANLKKRKARARAREATPAAAEATGDDR